MIRSRLRLSNPEVLDTASKWLTMNRRHAARTDAHAGHSDALPNRSAAVGTAIARDTLDSQRAFSGARQYISATQNSSIASTGVASSVSVYKYNSKLRKHSSLNVCTQGNPTSNGSTLAKATKHAS